MKREWDAAPVDAADLDVVRATGHLNKPKQVRSIIGSGVESPPFLAHFNLYFAAFGLVTLRGILRLTRTFLTPIVAGRIQDRANGRETLWTGMLRGTIGPALF